MAVGLLFLFLAVLCRDAMGAKELPVLEDDPQIGSEKGKLHVVANMECGAGYFVFQSLALKYSFDKVHQSGNLTRIISCDDASAIDPEDLAIMDSLVVPNWSIHPKTGDGYKAYNKPVGLMFWLAERKPTAEWTLIVDPDMQFKQPFHLEELSIPEGYALSSGYSYLKGVSNELAERHLPEVVPRTDALGGPSGRRADMTGAYYLLRTRDLLRVAPLWLKYTEDVRNDPNAWNLTGDTYVKPGGKAWISEMYGYAFAAAKADVWHRIDPTMQYYPGYVVKDIPVLMHYGLHMKLGDYTYDKHEHMNFKSFQCPPWNLERGRDHANDAGLFPHPPFPATIEEKNPRRLYGQLMIIESVNTINRALCQRHRAKCPDSDQLRNACDIVDRIGQQLDEAYEELHQVGLLCHDDHKTCSKWAAGNECEHNWSYMAETCRASCGLCRKPSPVHHPDTDKQSPSPVSQVPDVIETPEQVAVQEQKKSMDSIEKAKDDETLLSQEEAEKEMQRCAQLTAAALMVDVGCNQLVAHGYVELEDLRLLRMRIETNEHPLITVFRYIFITAVLLAGVLSLVLCCRTRVRHWNRSNQKTL